MCSSPNNTKIGMTYYIDCILTGEAVSAIDHVYKD